MKKSSKKIITFILVLTIGILYSKFFCETSAEINFFWNNPIYNTWISNVITGSASDNPMRDGILTITNWTNGNWWILWILHTNNIIRNHMEALNDTLKIIQNIVNYALWLVWLIWLIYMLVQWFIILTAWQDDSKQKKWFKWIKNGIIAMIWIWLSWFVISFVLWLINTLTV